jgi:hypothetical protein
MPLKLSLALSRKVGQPDFGSLGASCGIELELAEQLLFEDQAAFQRRVREAYVACDQAIHDELARHQSPPVPLHGNGHEPQANGHDHQRGSKGAAAPRNRGGRTARRPATPSQVRAIHAIADRKGIDLSVLLPGRFGVPAAAGLSLADASKLIDELQSVAEDAIY